MAFPDARGSSSLTWVSYHVVGLVRNEFIAFMADLHKAMLQWKC